MLDMLRNDDVVIVTDLTREWLQSAKSGGSKLRRPNNFQEKRETILNMYNSNDYSINEIITATGISKTSLYRLVTAQ